MRTVSANWLSAAQHAATTGGRSAAYAPIVLVDFTVLERYFASRQYVSTTRTYEYELARFDEGGIQALQVSLDEISNAVQLSSVTFRLLNLTQLWNTFDGALDNTRVQIWLTFDGLADTDALALFPGVVDRHSFSRVNLDLTLVDASFRLHRNLSTAIGGQYFPSAPQASRTQFIPIILGRAVDAPTIQIAGVAQGTLAFPLAAAATELSLVEMGAPFPATGMITIESETGITYSARDLVLRAGITYLRLSGLTRTAGVTHPTAAPVTLVSSEFVYLIGYEVHSLQGVRDDGAPVTSEQYTLVTMQADRPVSALIFSEQRGQVTVDVNGPNVDLNERVVNGGFESGDLTGWTLSAGTGVVGSANPAPYVGLYRAALTAPSSSAPGLLFQDIAVLPGATYVLRLVYQNVKGVSLLTNAGFETGDLTGWTIANLWASTQYGVVRGNSPPGSYQAVFGTHAVYLGPAAGGLSFLEVTGGGLTSGSYKLDLYQDVATIIGTQYAFRAFFRFGLESSAYTILGAPATAMLSHSRGEVRAGSTDIAKNTATFGSAQALYMLGTPASPGAYSIGALDTTVVGPSFWNLSTDTVVTAQTTTTRVTITAVGSFSGFPPYPVCFDEVQLEPLGSFITSTLAVDLGTPADSALIQTETFDAVYAWTPMEIVVQIPETVDTLRLTLRSTYNGVSGLACYLDQVSLRLGYSAAGLGGENPVQAIRYILDTFLPDATYDADNFDQMAQVLIGWKFGAVLTNAGDSRALLQRMAYQCGSLLFQDGEGRFKLVALNASRVVQLGFNVSSIVEGSCTISYEPMDNLYTDIYVWFAAKTGGGATNADFQGVVYATPTGTTAVSVPLLVTQCGAALATYGREHRLDYYADFIQDVGTAHLLLTWLVSRLTIRHTLVTFRTWLDGIVLEMGDLIQVTHPLVGNGTDPVVCEVMSQQTDFSRMEVEITARTIELAGWTATFEYTLHLIQDAGWVSAFDFTPVPDPDNTGWQAEFESS